MTMEIRTKDGVITKNFDSNESAFFKCIGEELLNISIPNTLYAIDELGNEVSYDIKQRGTVTVNGVKGPSMYVTCTDKHIIGFKDHTPPKYEEAYLTCINPEGNNYKYYKLIPLASSRELDAEYGRIGAKPGEMFGQKRLQTPYEDHLYWIRYYEKLSKGYTDQSNIFLSKPLNVSANMNPVKANMNPVKKNLLDKLARFSRNYVLDNLGTGIVTVKQVRQANRLFKELSERKTLAGFNKKLSELFVLSPRKTRDIRLLMAKSKQDFKTILDREEVLLKAMGGVVSYNTGLDGIEVYEATDKQKDKVLSKLSDSLKGKVKQIYRVIPNDQKDKFNKYLKDNHIRHVKEFWHGSRNENWLSIIENSLELCPNAQITGKMFGDGIYFAPSSMKSWNYTSYKGTSWAHGSSDTAFMGVYATAYGNPKKVQTSVRETQATLMAAGYNCLHAEKGVSLLNDEIVFYDEDAVLLNYIVEFE